MCIVDAYFYESTGRYCGMRTLAIGEPMPVTATATPVVVPDGKEAFWSNGTWTVEDVTPEQGIITENPVLTLEEIAESLTEQAKSINSQAKAIMVLSLE